MSLFRPNHILFALFVAGSAPLVSCSMDQDSVLVTDSGTTAYELKIPSNLPPITVPDDNPVLVLNLTSGKDRPEIFEHPFWGLISLEGNYRDFEIISGSGFGPLPFSWM